MISANSSATLHHLIASAEKWGRRRKSIVAYINDIKIFSVVSILVENNRSSAILHCLTENFLKTFLNDSNRCINIGLTIEKEILELRELRIV
jgi:hypothetical protein